MDDISLTDRDKHLGVYLIGVIKGYYEGYGYAQERIGLDPEPGRDDSVADSTSSRARSAAPLRGAETAPSSTTHPDPEDVAARRGMVAGLAAIAEEYFAAGLIEAGVRAEQHAAALERSLPGHDWPES